MSFVKYGLFFLLLLLSACGDIGDDLIPAGRDQRPVVQAGTIGWRVGQNAPLFSLLDSNNTTVDLPSALAGKKGAVLYFTMWCPICDSHMDDALVYVIPAFRADVNFFAVDYLSGSVALAKEAAGGYVTSDFRILVDLTRQLTVNYAATMGTTIVIDSNGIIRMNQDYHGPELAAILRSLP